MHDYLCGQLRQAAKAEGRIKYSTGAPCKKGHISERYVRNGKCVECSRGYVKKCADKRREKKAEYDRARCETYRERRAALAKERYALNREEAAERWRAYYAKNKAKLNEKNKIWREENREHLELYRAATADRIAERCNRHYRENYQAYLVRGRARRAALKAAEGSHTVEDISRMRQRQKEKCAFCKTSIVAGFHVDHIHPLSLGGGNGPDNLQLLCATCNLKKGAKDPIVWRQQNGMLL